MDNATRGAKFAGIVFSPVGPRGRVKQESQSPVEETHDDEQFDALMSLALDDMLNPEQAEQFDRALGENPGFVDAWEQWQTLDRTLHSAPRAEPPADFVVAFEGRMRKRERRRRLWLGVAIGLVAVALWGSLVVGLGGASAYVMFNQSGWLVGAVRFLVYCSAFVQGQIAGILSAFGTAVATPQMQGMALAYTVFALFTLWFWAKFLRRSVEHRGSAAMSGAS